MPAAASIEAYEPNPASGLVGGAVDHLDSPGRLQLIQAGGIEIPAPANHSPLTEEQFMVVALLSMGKTLNQIRGAIDASRGTIDTSRDEAVQVEQEAKTALGVNTPYALVGRAIVQGILPIDQEPVNLAERQITPRDRLILKSYTADLSVEQIASNIGMTVSKFVGYEPVLQLKLGVRKRPPAVRQGYAWGILSH